MRDVQNNFLKLLLLADHLSAGNLKYDYHNLHYLYIPKFNRHIIGNHQHYYFIFPYVVSELPHLFSE